MGGLRLLGGLEASSECIPRDAIHEAPLLQHQASRSKLNHGPALTCSNFDMGMAHVAASFCGITTVSLGGHSVHIHKDLQSFKILEILAATHHLCRLCGPDFHPSKLLGVVASPPCTTFSNYDGNRQIHRHHHQPGKPAKSNMAKQHDALVQHLFSNLFPQSA